MPTGVYTRSEEHKNKTRATLKGRIITPTWRQKISNTKMGSIVSEKTKDKISNTMKGIPKTEEHKKNIGKAKKILYSDPKNHPSYEDGRSLITAYCISCGKELSSYKRKECNKCANKTKWQNIEYVEKVINAMNKPEYKEERSKISKNSWKSGKMDGVFVSPTKPEKEIMIMLEELNLDYIFQFRPVNFSMIYDFYITKLNLLIEFDGSYWHDLPKVKIRDIKKTQYAEENNYNLLRVTYSNLDIFKTNVLNFIN